MAARVPALGGRAIASGLCMVFVAALACSPRSPQSAGGVVGTAEAKAVIAAMRAAESVRAPWRCARLRAPAAIAGPTTATGPGGNDLAGQVAGPASATPASEVFEAGRRWIVDGDVMRADAGDGLRLGVVADTGGSSDAARAALTRVGTLFAQAHVDVVAAVGGIGTTEDELVAALEPLTRGAWPVIAIPGDRESWPALRRAVARLRSSGVAIVDGASIRFIESGGVTAATLPGMPFRERLAADDDGCGHDDTDVAAVLTALTSRRGPHVLLTPRAPRATGEGSNLATGGVHAGDVALGRALKQHPVDVVIHGQIADRPIKVGRASRGPVVVPAGRINPTPRFDEVGARLPAQALVVTVERRGAIDWQPLVAVPGT